MLYKNSKLEFMKEEENVVRKRNPEKSTTTDIKLRTDTFIGKIDEIPPKDIPNPFILTGYRANFNTPAKIVKS